MYQYFKTKIDYEKYKLFKKAIIKEELAKHSKLINYVLSLTTVLTKLF